jgi:hypothetical protein
MALGVALSKCTAETEFVLVRLTLSLSLSLSLAIRDDFHSIPLISLFLQRSSFVTIQRCCCSTGNNLKSIKPLSPSFPFLVVLMMSGFEEYTTLYYLLCYSIDLSRKIIHLQYYSMMEIEEVIWAVVGNAYLIWTLMARPLCRCPLTKRQFQWLMAFEITDRSPLVLPCLTFCKLLIDWRFARWVSEKHPIRAGVSRVGLIYRNRII